MMTRALQITTTKANKGHGYDKSHEVCRTRNLQVGHPVAALFYSNSILKAIVLLRAAKKVQAAKYCRPLQS